MKNQIDVRQLQSDLPQYLHQVEAGETLVVCQDQKPIAELRPIKQLRRVGLGKGQITLAPNCFAPLPEEVIEGFEGKEG